MSIELCKSCKKPFSVIEIPSTTTWEKEKEPIECPYCNYEIQRKTNGGWDVKELNDEMQKEFFEKIEKV